MSIKLNKLGVISKGFFYWCSSVAHRVKRSTKSIPVYKLTKFSLSVEFSLAHFPPAIIQDIVKKQENADDLILRLKWRFAGSGISWTLMLNSRYQTLPPVMVSCD